LSALKTAIGLMSGTSMDGIDVALIKTDGYARVERGASGFYPYTPRTRELLQQALIDATEIKLREDRPGCLANAEENITRLHVEAVMEFLKDHNMGVDDVDLLGFHGQTVLHRPNEALTVQIGDGQALANETGIDVVYDMRANDMVYGGQGAPLIPIYHQALADNVSVDVLGDGPVCFVNIGGISNITYVGDELVAFDCGPGNALIDQWVQQQVGISHDAGGAIAAEGTIDTAFVERYLADEFFEKPVPKSLDRNDFRLPDNPTLSVEDVTRSLARVSAEGIIAAARHLPQMPGLWIICGGGRHNPYIMQDLVELAEKEGSRAVSAEVAGFDGDAMEAEGWAYLAVRSSLGLPLTFPRTTGCSMSVSGGAMVMPIAARTASMRNLS